MVIETKKGYYINVTIAKYTIISRCVIFLVYLILG